MYNPIAGLLRIVLVFGSAMGRTDGAVERVVGVVCGALCARVGVGGDLLVSSH